MAYVHTLFLGICNAMLQFVQQVFFRWHELWKFVSCKIFFLYQFDTTCIVNIEHRNEAGLIMRTDWEVIRQAASDRTLRVWAWRISTVPRCAVSDFLCLWEFGAWCFSK